MAIYLCILFMYFLGCGWMINQRDDSPVQIFGLFFGENVGFVGQCSLFVDCIFILVQWKHARFSSWDPILNLKQYNKLTKLLFCIMWFYYPLIVLFGKYLLPLLALPLFTIFFFLLQCSINYKYNFNPLVKYNIRLSVLIK